MTLEELEVLITLNAAQLKSEILNVRKEMKTLGGSTDQISSSIGGTMTKSVFKGMLAFEALKLSVKAVSSVIRFAFRTISTALRTFASEMLKSISVSHQFESAILGLESVALRKLGQESMPLATQAAQELTKDGLLPLTDAATGLKNLLASNFSLEESIKLMNVFKDSAAFGRQSALSFGEAVSSATEGIKNGNSILVDNAGITKNLSNILVEAGFSQQDLNRATSDAAVRQALYNGLLREGALFQGDAAKLANTSQGQLAKVTTTLKNLRSEIGKFLGPIQQVVLGGLNLFLNGIRQSLGLAEGNIKSFVARIAGFLVALVRIIGRVLMQIPVIGKNFAAMANFTIQVAQSQDQLGGSAGEASDQIDNVAESAKKAQKELRGLAAFDELNVLADTKGDQGAGDLAPVVGGGAIGEDLGLSAITDDINKNADIWEARFLAVKERIKEIWSDIVEFYENSGIKAIVDLLIERFEIIKGRLEELWGTIMNSPLGVIFQEAARIIGAIFVGAVFVAVLAVEGIILTIQNAIETFNKWFDIAVIAVSGIILEFDVLKKWVKTVVEELKKYFTGLGTFLKGVFTLDFKKMKDGLQQMWGAMVNILKATWTAFAETIKIRIRSAVDIIGRYFEGMPAKVKTVASKIKGFFSDMAHTIGNSIKSVLNGVIDGINRFFRTLNNTRIPDWVPSVGGRGFSMPYIPRLAEGGIITSSTLLEAGERGHEAILPLDRNTQWMDDLANKISQNGGGNMNLTVKVGERKIYEGLVEFINEGSLARGNTLVNI